MAEEIKELAADEPAPDYTPMSDIFAETEEKRKTYEGPSDADAARAAAEDLTKERAEETPITPRAYVMVGGEDDGKVMPENETIDLDRAVRDLDRQRGLEAGEVVRQADESTAFIADYIRTQGQAQQPQQQPQVDAQQQAQQQAEVQQQQQQPADDAQVLQAALERPAVREALSNQLQQLEASRQQYATATTQAFEMSAAATFAQFDELRGVNIQSLPAVLAAVEKNNPQRAQAMLQAINATERLHQQSRQAEAAQAEVRRAQQAVWAKNEDAKFSESIKGEPREVYELVTRNAARLLKQNFGIEPEQFKSMIESNPGLRSAEAQAILYTALKAQLTAEGVAAKKVPAHIPPVQRPGTSQPQASADDAEAASALREFNKSPDPKTAAKYLQARRAARNR